MGWGLLGLGIAKLGLNCVGIAGFRDRKLGLTGVGVAGG